MAKQNGYDEISFTAGLDTIFYVDFDEIGRILYRNSARGIYAQEFYANNNVKMRYEKDFNGHSTRYLFDNAGRRTLERSYRNGYEICREYDDGELVYLSETADSLVSVIQFKRILDDGTMKLIYTDTSFTRNWMDTLGGYLYEFSTTVIYGDTVIESVLGRSRSYLYEINCLKGTTQYSYYIDADNYYSYRETPSFTEVSMEKEGVYSSSIVYANGYVETKENTEYGWVKKGILNDTLVLKEEYHYSGGDPRKALLKKVKFEQVKLDESYTIVELIDPEVSRMGYLWTKYNQDSVLLKKVKTKFNKHGDKKKEIVWDKEKGRSTTKFENTGWLGDWKVKRKQKKYQGEEYIFHSGHLMLPRVDVRIFTDDITAPFYEELLYFEKNGTKVNYSEFKYILGMNYFPDSLVFETNEKGVLETRDTLNSRPLMESAWEYIYFIEGAKMKYGRNALLEKRYLDGREPEKLFFEDRVLFGKVWFIQAGQIELR